VISQTTPRFWTAYHNLPSPIQDAARKAYRFFRAEPHHPSLQFKKIHGAVYSVRVTRGYRALGRLDGERVTWFWIGNHADYDRLVKSL
jgi:hypothetical protein